MFNTQNIHWSQMSRLPDALLEEFENEELSWQDVKSKCNPAKAIFIASECWKSALISLNIPVDDIHLGLVEGPLKPPFNSNTLSSIQACTKVQTLIVQVTSTPKDRMFKVSDMTAEVECSIHPKVLSQYSFQEGAVLLLHNITILPGLILNLTEKNIVKVFK